MRSGLLLLLMMPAPSFGVGLGRGRASLHHGPRDRSPARRAQAVLRATIATSWCCASTIPTRGAWPGGTRAPITSSISAGPISVRIRSRRLPRDYGAAVEKFGIATLKRIGTLPWREAEQFGNLRRAFEGFRRNFVYAPNDTVLFAAVASHYLQDAHMPLHASNNNDGQLTGQNGVHARFETALFERYQSKLTITPVAASRRSPTRATPRSRRCSPAISWCQRLLQADKDAARDGNGTTTSTSIGSLRTRGPFSSSRSPGPSRRRRRSSPAPGKRRESRTAQ